MIFVWWWWDLYTYLKWTWFWSSETLRPGWHGDNWRSLLPPRSGHLQTVSYRVTPSVHGTAPRSTGALDTHPSLMLSLLKLAYVLFTNHWKDNSLLENTETFINEISTFPKFSHGAIFQWKHTFRLTLLINKVSNFHKSRQSNMKVEFHKMTHVKSRPT